MATTVIESITDFLFGHKYYANIVNRRGTDEIVISNYIFRTKEEADKHRHSFDGNMSFLFIETVSFRSRKAY